MCQFWQIFYSIRNRKALSVDAADPWDGRTLEWATASPAQEYNFAHIPTVSQIDDYWYKKKQWLKTGKPKPAPYVDIHMPKSTPVGFFIGLFAILIGFALTWHMWLIAICSFIVIITTLIVRSYNPNTEYYIKAADVQATEEAILAGER